ncbi:hypothetical protein [Synechococcus phage Ssp-JY38]|nr:hypothetical protein [Synechococcus phage Yong-L2-223]
MNVEKPAGCTRVLGEEQGYLPLPIRDELTRDSGTGIELPSMVSCYRPTPEELTCLLNGGRIYLRILGNAHPPVALWAE